jgi:hypothetical protein
MLVVMLGALQTRSSGCGSHSLTYPSLDHLPSPEILRIRASSEVYTPVLQLAIRALVGRGIEGDLVMD